MQYRKLNKQRNIIRVFSKPKILNNPVTITQTFVSIINNSCFKIRFNKTKCTRLLNTFFEINLLKAISHCHNVVILNFSLDKQ